MKKICLIALLLSSISWTQAMSNEEALTLKAKADLAYEQGELEKAIPLYDSLAQHYRSAEVEYNLGNSYFRSKNVPLAILHYERALRLEPDDEDVKHNLQLAHNLTVDRIESDSDAGITEWWNGKLLSIGEYNWAWSGILMAFLFAAFMALFFGRRQSAMRQIFIGISGLSLVLCILFSSFSFSARSAMQARDSAIITLPKLDVLSAPNENATDLFVLHEGTKVRVIKEDMTWVNISLPNGLIGWVRKADLEVI